MSTIDLPRGDDIILDIADLLDAAGESTMFVDGDVVRWTAKRLRSHTDEQAILAKSNTDDPSGIVLAGDGGTITIDATDWTPVTETHDFGYFWDLQLTRAEKVRTLASGTGTVTADITRTSP